MAAKSEKKAGSHKPGHLSVTGTKHDADGVQYTVCGCSVEEVREELDKVDAQPRQTGQFPPTDIKAEG